MEEFSIDDVILVFGWSRVSADPGFEIELEHFMENGIKSLINHAIMSTLICALQIIFRITLSLNCCMLNTPS